MYLTHIRAKTFLRRQIATDISDILLLRMIPFNFLIVFMFGNHADKGSEMMVLSKGWFISSYHPHDVRCGQRY